MAYSTMNQSGFIRYSARIIFLITLSMSSIVFAENNDENVCYEEGECSGSSEGSHVELTEEEAYKYYDVLIVELVDDLDVNLANNLVIELVDELSKNLTYQYDGALIDELILDLAEDAANEYRVLTVEELVARLVAELANADAGGNSQPSAAVNTEYNPIIYAGAAVTLGAHSKVFGNIQAVAAVTLGEAAVVDGSLLAGAAVTLDKDGEVIGDITAGEAATLGGFSLVHGDLSALATVFMGAGSEILGDLTSDADATLGADAVVGGNATALTSVTLGADAQVGKEESLGNVWAVTGPIVLGDSAQVKGEAKSANLLSFGMNATVGSIEIHYATPDELTNDGKGSVATLQVELTQKQQDLGNMSSAPYNELDTTIAMSRGFDSGVYHASALTTTAGITLTFKGSLSDEPEEWLINVDSYISFGANLKIKLDENVAPDSTIVFNSGTYTTIGANSNVIGTIIAGTYITTGEKATITGIGSDCGGMFATNGAITIGARSTFGTIGCGPAEQQDEDEGEYQDADEGEYEYGYDE
jgi:predicted acyltransferase (DUF342 family)